MTLRTLNDATAAWVEMEYNRSVHSETKQKPIDRFLKGKNVGRICPDLETLKDGFTCKITRIQRQTDGTIQVEGKRFEIPSRYRHMEKIWVRYARWDLSHVFIVNDQGKKLTAIYPVDLVKNATSQRRAIETDLFKKNEDSNGRSHEIAPLLKKLMAEYAATGLPPAYIPKD